MPFEIKHFFRILWLFFILFNSVSTLYANPEKDYQAGYQAYQSDDPISAMSDLKKAADAGHAKAQSLLGYIFDKAEENDTALYYYSLAAEQEYPEAQYRLGSLYASGEVFEKKDYSKALEWFTKAAEKGYGPAVEVLAISYLDGGLGLSKNTSTAIDILKIGWVMGFKSSDKRLAALLKENIEK